MATHLGHIPAKGVSKNRDSINLFSITFMTVYEIDPLQDARWAEFTRAHPQACPFHSAAWLRTLQQTYSYEPVAFTTCGPGQQLSNGVLFCRVRSWLTGSRLVSLPFADHCEPLADSADLTSILEHVADYSNRHHMRYVEVRPIRASLPLNDGVHFASASQYVLQTLDLAEPIDSVFRHFNKNSVQRQLRRNKREELVYEESAGPALLKKFYQLMVMTRRRHRVPPQPMVWFRNLLDNFGEGARIRLVSKENAPAAAILTVHWNQTTIYKYGCSDPRFNRMGGTTLLFWEAIQDAKQLGALRFDMGRSDLDNPGLINFKSHWGTDNSPLIYWRFPTPAKAKQTNWPRMRELAASVISYLPDRCLTAVGNALYKHAG